MECFYCQSKLVMRSSLTCACIIVHSCLCAPVHSCERLLFKQGTGPTFTRRSSTTIQTQFIPLPLSNAKSFDKFYVARERKYTGEYKYDQTINGTINSDDFPLLTAAQSRLILDNRSNEPKLPLRIDDTK